MPAVFAADHEDADRGVDRAADVFLSAVSDYAMTYVDSIVRRIYRTFYPYRADRTDARSLVDE